jgi:hypothetical protein
MDLQRRPENAGPMMLVPNDPTTGAINFHIVPARLPRLSFSLHHSRGQFLVSQKGEWSLCPHRNRARGRAPVFTLGFITLLIADAGLGSAVDAAPAAQDGAAQPGGVKDPSKLEAAAFLKRDAAELWFTGRARNRERALSRLRRAIDLQKQAYASGEGDEIVSTLNILAGHFMALDRMSECVGYSREALAMLERLRGAPADPEVVNLRLLLKQTEKFAKLTTEQRARARQVLQDHEDAEYFAWAVSSVEACDAMIKKTEEAQRVYREVGLGGGPTDIHLETGLAQFQFVRAMLENNVAGMRAALVNLKTALTKTNGMYGAGQL